MNDTWKQLDKISELEEQAHFSELNKIQHHMRHVVKHEGGKNDELFDTNLTADEYDELAHKLSSASASPLGSSPNEVQGLIDQAGRKVKFFKLEGSKKEFVIYVGDDLTGTVITYFINDYPQIMTQANPFVRGKLMNKYKCDLDGNYRGLSAFIIPKKMSSDEVEDIRYKIENDIPLDED